MTYAEGRQVHHPASSCDPDPCPLHRPSEHHMRDWPMVLKMSGLTDRLCPDHRTGHPDPDSLAWMQRERPAAMAEVHGCCGCCRPP